MHFFGGLPTYAFKSFFANMQVGIMIEQGLIDINDTDAVAKVFNDIDEAVETINVSFVMSKSECGSFIIISRPIYQ